MMPQETVTPLTTSLEPFPRLLPRILGKNPISSPSVELMCLQHSCKESSTITARLTIQTLH